MRELPIPESRRLSDEDAIICSAVLKSIVEIDMP
jgi:hypothetical protein